jgi:hypothetical protein
MRGDEGDELLDLDGEEVRVGLFVDITRINIFRSYMEAGQDFRVSRNCRGLAENNSMSMSV